MQNKITFSNYGPFKKQDNQIQLAPCVTLLIGKNNSGKSCIIDLICSLFESETGRQDKPWPEKLLVDFPIGEKEIEQIFGHDGFGNKISGKQCDFGKQYADSVFQVGIERGIKYKSFYAASDQKSARPEYAVLWDRLASAKGEDFVRELERFKVRMISAERDVTAESHTGRGAVELQPNGEGATALIQKYLNESGQDESIIEETLLAELNNVMAPDAKFENIRTQIIGTDEAGLRKWEVFLQEANDARRPLSSLGSGLKTIILILLQLLNNEPPQREKFFLFEELENSLHPSLQRRVFEYLYNYSKNNNVQLVISSHSQTAINVFIEKQDCAVYSINKGVNGIATIQKIVSTQEGFDVLRELGIKASDLFQANGIIWVEGPSDRIYINAWLKSYFGNEFIEGTHYQFQFYGGKLLSHYTAEETAEKINVMFTNRNAAIVIDSDKGISDKDVNATKQRVRKEFNSRNLFYWITKGKEIENYISADVLDRAYPEMSDWKQVKQYENFSKYIMKAEPRFSSKKVGFARKVSAYISERDLDVMDLQQKIVNLGDTIRAWNA